jgi:hypothetical protein
MAPPPVHKIRFGQDNLMLASRKRLLLNQLEPFLPAQIPDAELENVSAASIRQRKKAHFQTWLNQFKPKDRADAMLLLDKLTYIDHPKLMGYLKRNHQQLLKRLVQDGFAQAGANPLDKADFTTLYQASSGGLISYFYRKANQVPKVKFFDQETLAARPATEQKDRALVIVDDYMATGVQFLAEAYGLGDRLPNTQNRALPELMKRYKKVYFLVVRANEQALSRFRAIEQGHAGKALDDMLQGYVMTGESDDRYKKPIRERLQALPPGRLSVMAASIEAPLLSAGHPKVSSEERQRLKAFLERNNVYKYPYGVGNLQGNTVFFYSTPNTLPDILWNSKSRRLNADGSRSEHHFQPLFHRMEDVSAYWYASAYKVPPEKQVW